jgi:hypothetical protein
MICTREPCSPSILAALSALSRVVGRSSWASVRPGPDSDPGYTLVAPSALKRTYFSAPRKQQLVARQNRPKSALNKRQTPTQFRRAAKGFRIRSQPD